MLQLLLLLVSVASLAGHLLQRKYGRTRITLTRQGWWYLGVTVGVMVAALNTGNNLFYLLLSLLLTFLVLHGVLAEWNLRRVVVERRLPADAFAGLPASGALRLRNTRRWLGSFGLTVEEVDGGVLTAHALQVPPDGEVEIPADWRFEHRGEARLSGLRLSSSFPFGLFHRARVRALPAALLIWPAPMDGGVARGSIARGSQDEDARSAGGGGEVLGVREYQHGDDLRRVHWATTARSGRPMLLQRARLSAREVVLRLPSPTPDLEASVSRATGEALKHLREGRAVGLELGDQRIAPASDARQRRRLLDALAIWGRS